MAPQRFDLGHWRWPCWVAAVGVFLLAVGVPLANLTYQAGLVVHQSGTTHVRAWSAERFVELIVPLPGRYERAAAWRFQREFGWTIILSGTTATLSLLAAVPLGWWARRGGRPGLPAALLIAMGLAVPGPLVGIAVIWLFTRGTSTWSIWLYNQTLAAPLLALMWRCLPLTILVCWFAASTIPTCREDAAAVDGIGPIGRFWFFCIGQRKLALGVAWLVAAAIAGGDLTTSILVAPPGVTTLPIRVFNLLHAGVDDEVAAICLLNIAVIAALGAVVLFLGAHWIDRITRAIGHGNVKQRRCSENQRPTQTSCVVAGVVLAVRRCGENQRPTQTSCVVAGSGVGRLRRCSENQRPTQTSCVVAGGRCARVVAALCATFLSERRESHPLATIATAGGTFLSRQNLPLATAATASGASAMCAAVFRSRMPTCYLSLSGPGDTRQVFNFNPAGCASLHPGLTFQRVQERTFFRSTYSWRS